MIARGFRRRVAGVCGFCFRSEVCFFPSSFLPPYFVLFVTREDKVHCERHLLHKLYTFVWFGQCMGRPHFSPRQRWRGLKCEGFFNTDIVWDSYMLPNAFCNILASPSIMSVNEITQLRVQKRPHVPRYFLCVQLVSCSRRRACALLGREDVRSCAAIKCVPCFVCRKSILFCNLSPRLPLPRPWTNNIIDDRVFGNLTRFE